MSMDSPQLRSASPLAGDPELGSRIEELENTLSLVATENIHLSEALNNIDMMVDARGWKPLYDNNDGQGLTLAQLHDISRQIRELAIANPLIRRGSELRNIATWGGGVEFVNEKNKPLKKSVQKLIKSKRNRRYVFSPDAYEELERAVFTEGNVYLLGDDRTKEIQRIPIREITADLRNPDNYEEIWAYRREWNPDPYDKSRVKVRWYYTDIHDGRRATSLKVGQDQVQQVDNTKTIIDGSFNSQIGWPFGVPDALSVIAWARLYREFLVNGYVMSRALAQIAFKVMAKTAQGGQNASVEVNQPGQSGSTATMGEGLDMAPLATAGKGYDFASGRPMLSQLAAALGVSLVALTGDSGAAGGSSASEQTLGSPTRLVAAMRRQAWDEFFDRLFSYLGQDDVKVIWHDLSDEQVQRRLQSWVLAHNSGLFKPEVVQAGIATELGISEYGEIPEGYLPMNNVKSAKAAQLGSGQDGTQDTSKTAGTGQGQNSPAGEAPNDHDTDEK
ncbi:hypothetical protein CMP1-12 [Clavibacter phage CMP1]|uniref:Portal protein n=1 Tax=Clavibacter phage CMP1 TaxID=686439 RepID=D0U1Z6_9CAUD|nr:portal protein [Clavibacter phage CMP1]ACY35908.1 hypothetical protein CMP1-12 [Clavibacter phage CMP1]